MLPADDKPRFGFRIEKTFGIGADGYGVIQGCGTPWENQILKNLDRLRVLLDSPQAAQ